MITFSEIESRRFRKQIYRGSSRSADLTAVRQALEHPELNTLIYRIPATAFCELHKFNVLNVEMIVADVLMYYSLLLDSYEAKVLKNSAVVITPAITEDIVFLEPLIRETFEGYTNHYYSNPGLDKTHILDGYTEWAISHVSLPGRICFVAREKGEIIAFAACSYEEDRAEGVLFGVRPASSGRGIYADLIRFANGYFKEQGYRKIRVSTQVQNYAVQKVWMREQYLVEEAYITLHFNKKPSSNKE